MAAENSPSNPPRRLLIAVIGAGECSPEQAAVAEEVGRGLARGGAALICGGLGGVMEAACRGAAAEGGLTIGILPADDPSSANPHVRIAIASGVGQARNIAVTRSARAVIAIGGEFGTLSEIAFALRGGVPVVGFNTWALSRTIGDPPQRVEDDRIIVAGNAVDAVEMALAVAAKE